ncbi:MAG: hypothetical protein ACM3ZB_12170 [bacterium]
MAGVTAVTMAVAGASSPGRTFICSAQNFVSNYRAIDELSVPAGFLEKVAISLALTRSHTPPQACVSRCGTL